MQLTMKFLLTVAILPATALAKYKLTKDYSGYDFVSGFDFYNGPDPTNGHVQYKGYATANATGLAGFLLGPNGTNSNNSTAQPPVYLGVDYNTVYPTNVGRPSVRVSSVDTYNHSLVIADILHMPSSTCGLWPAFWMLGTSAPWPGAGEVDIIENVNDNDFNIMTLHTNAGAIVTNDTSLFNGTMKASNCDINARDQEKNVGCGIKDNPDVKSYGTNFNDNKGGVFAVRYNDSDIAIWFFPRNAIPADIISGSPSPPSVNNATGSAWGKPNALFQPVPQPTNTTTPATSSTAGISPTPTPTTSTNATATAAPSILTQHFNSLQLVISTTFCGDWAGKTWNATSCGKLAPTCEEHVSKNPGAFKEAYWAIQSIKVYLDEHAPSKNQTELKKKKKKKKKAVQKHGKRHIGHHGVKFSGEMKDKLASGVP